MSVLAAILIGLGLIWVPAGTAADPPDRAILLILPTPGEVRPWVPDGPTQVAEGQELFALFNGGAEILLRHGFERAATQTYSHAGDRHVQVEIYRMVTADGAAEVFLRKTQGERRPFRRRTRHAADRSPFG